MTTTELQEHIAQIEREHERRVRSIGRWHRIRMAVLLAVTLSPAIAFVLWGGGSR